MHEFNPLPLPPLLPDDNGPLPNGCTDAAAAAADESIDCDMGNADEDDGEEGDGYKLRCNNCVAFEVLFVVTIAPRDLLAEFVGCRVR